MNKKQFEKLGFTVEFLPSGRLNIIHNDPFRHNGVNTINCRRVYTRTTDFKSFDALLKGTFELEFIKRASFSKTTVAKEKTPKTTTARRTRRTPQQKQQVTAVKSAPVKPTHKPKKRIASR